MSNDQINQIDKEPVFFDVLSIPSNPEDIFTLLYPIGKGAFGEVYKAIHNNSKRIYAIKILHFPKYKNTDETISDENKLKEYYYKSFQQESMLMKLFNKSNFILKYYGSYYSRKSGDIWLILEYCAFGSTIDLMFSVERTFTEKEISIIISMVLQALIVMHKMKLIHRDIKGANILINEFGIVKLADFGIGIITDENKKNSTKGKKGSPHWMSPQVASNLNYDTKTDIWSLGITCIELIEGLPPFSNLLGENIMDELSKGKINYDYIFNNKNYSIDFRDFLKRCLNYDSEKRASALELTEHSFIKKYSNEKNYLNNLIKNRLKDVENYRKTNIDHYLGKLNNPIDQNISIQKNLIEYNSKNKDLDKIYKNNLENSENEENNLPNGMNNNNKVNINNENFDFFNKTFKKENNDKYLEKKSNVSNEDKMDRNNEDIKSNGLLEKNNIINQKKIPQPIKYEIIELSPNVLKKNRKFDNNCKQSNSINNKENKSQKNINGTLYKKSRTRENSNNKTRNYKKSELSKFLHNTNYMNDHSEYNETIYSNNENKTIILSNKYKKLHNSFNYRICKSTTYMKPCVQGKKIFLKKQKFHSIKQIKNEKINKFYKYIDNNIKNKICTQYNENVNDSDDGGTLNPVNKYKYDLRTIENKDQNVDKIVLYYKKIKKNKNLNENVNEISKNNCMDQDYMINKLRCRKSGKFIKSHQKYFQNLE